MYRFRLFALAVWLLLPGCLLTYLFAPKISAERLPASVDHRRGRETYIQLCGRCHLLIDPVFYRQNINIEIFLLRYLQQKVIHEREAMQIRNYILEINRAP
jgi:hypothetical protein